MVLSSRTEFVNSSSQFLSRVALKGDRGTEKGISKFCMSNRSTVLWGRLVSVEFSLFTLVSTVNP